MDAPFADFLFLVLALAGFAGLIALAKVMERVTAPSTHAALAARASATPGTGDPGTSTAPRTPHDEEPLA